MSGRTGFALVLGVLMILLGAYVALRPLIPPHVPISGRRWLDVAFAFFFILRGAMNVRAARRVAAREAGEV